MALMQNMIFRRQPRIQEQLLHKKKGKKIIYRIIRTSLSVRKPKDDKQASQNLRGKN